MEKIETKKKKFLSKRVTLDDIARHCSVSTSTVSRVLSGRANEVSISEAVIQRVKTAAEQLDYRPGRKIPSKQITMQDIARYCNVSIATVSRVLSGSFNGFPVSEDMVQRVKTAAEQLDYRPNRLASAIRSQRTHLIGLSCMRIKEILSRTTDRVDYEDMLMGRYTGTITGHPEFKDYDLVIHTRDESADQPLKPSDFNSDLLDGMIYLTPSDNHSEFLDVASKDFPIVLLGEIPGAAEKIPCVDINNRKMGKQAVEHLIELGRRNILMLIPEKLQHLTCMQDRRQGYCDALAENGIPISDDFIQIVSCIESDINGFFENFQGLEEVDAIFCATDDLAAFCIAPLKAMGKRIPEDIALMGFDDTPVSQHATPPLSSVHRPAGKQVYTAIDLLLKILRKEVPYEPGFHEIEAELVIRESTEGTKQAHKEI